MFAFFGLGPQEIALLVVVGVLLFGRRLPEVGKNVAQSIRSFQQGWKGLEDDITSTPAVTTQPTLPMIPPARVAPAAPKFEANA